MKKWFRKRFFSIKMFRKHMVKNDLICCLDNIETTLDYSCNADEIIEHIRHDLFMTKVNLSWMVGTIDRDTYEDFYRMYHEVLLKKFQPGKIVDILKFKWRTI